MLIFRNYQCFCDNILKLLVIKNEKKHISQSTPIKNISKKSGGFEMPLKEELAEETFRPLTNLTDNRNVNIWVQSILKNKLNAKEMKLLNHLIEKNDELLFAAFKLFENERDEEEIADTIMRIIQKSKQVENGSSAKKNQNSHSKPIHIKKEEEVKEIDNFNNENNASYFKNKKLSSSEKKESQKEVKDLAMNNVNHNENKVRAAPNSEGKVNHNENKVINNQNLDGVPRMALASIFKVKTFLFCKLFLKFFIFLFFKFCNFS